MLKPDVSTLRHNVDLSKPREFRRMSLQMCNRKNCIVYSKFRIGKLDVCGRHTSWAIEFQLGEGETWSSECFVARYSHHG